MLHLTSIDSYIPQPGAPKALNADLPPADGHKTAHLSLAGKPQYHFLWKKLFNEAISYYVKELSRNTVLTAEAQHTLLLATCALIRSGHTAHAAALVRLAFGFLSNDDTLKWIDASTYAFNDTFNPIT